MTDVDLMFRTLRLAWIPRLLTAGDCNWCTVPYHFFRNLGGLNFLLRTVPTKYKSFCARLGPCVKSRSLQGLLESTKKNRGSHAFFSR